MSKNNKSFCSGFNNKHRTVIIHHVFNIQLSISWQQSSNKLLNLAQKGVRYFTGFLLNVWGYPHLWLCPHFHFLRRGQSGSQVSMYILILWEIWLKYFYCFRRFLERSKDVFGLVIRGNNHGLYTFGCTSSVLQLSFVFGATESRKEFKVKI